MALEHGIGRDEIESLTRDGDAGWSARTRTLLTAADELLESKNLSAATYRRVQGELNDDQIVEFCMIVGHYVMAAMMVNVAGCETEGPCALADAKVGSSVPAAEL